MHTYPHLLHALGHHAYISGKALVAVLILYMYGCVYAHSYMLTKNIQVLIVMPK